MSQEVSKWLLRIIGYNLRINGVYWGYNLVTNHLLTSWDIQVGPRILRGRKWSPNVRSFHRSHFTWALLTQAEAVTNKVVREFPPSAWLGRTFEPVFLHRAPWRKKGRCVSLIFPRHQPSYCKRMIEVLFNHLFSIVFRFHSHSQKVIGSFVFFL